MKTLIELLEQAIRSVREGMSKIEFKHTNLKVSVYRISNKQIRIDLVEE